MDKNEITFHKSNKKGYENKRVTNVLKILYMLLKNDNQDIQYYAEQLGCKAPTVKKYIKDIRDSYNAYDNSGFDVLYNSSKKHYELFSHMKFPALTPEAVEALYMAVRYLINHEGTPFENLQDIEKILQKYFTREIKEKLNKPIDVSGPEIKSRLKDVLNIIDEAINRKMKLVLTYTPTFHKDNIIREIVPFSLHIYDYEWYIKGFCLLDRKLKKFAVNQIVDMKCEELRKGEEKLIPEKVEMEEHRWDWTGKEENHEYQVVKIKFTGPMAVKMGKKTNFRKEHPSQKIELPSDDNQEEIIVTFEVKNPGNMLQWILQYGSQAQVIEPESLKNKIKTEVEAIQAMY